ncbi:MAG TPA: SDR family NAD(P)-dependent oxidoreductase [Pirellulaceae bacterium]|nr:SDR family NAD(P)-dependent oxidoreductase [Pirellulaceae bacterium]
MAQWQQQIVLVTGGSSGLGFAIARAFFQAGAEVILSSRDESRLRSAAAALSMPERACTWLTADLTQQSQAESLIEQAHRKHGRLDVLVNCAGKSTRGEVASTTAERFAEFLEINFLSAVRCTQAALPHLLQQRGHVVNIGSLAAKTVGPYLGAYPASKFPLAAYSQQLRLELGPQGLHVLLVCPGPIRRTDAGQRYTQHEGVVPAEALQPGGGVKMKGIDPDWLARRIVRACERREAELIVPSYVRALLTIAAISPSLADWLVRRWTQ